MKIIIAALCCITSLISTSASYAESKSIVKWVDKHGVTHYGDKAPMPTDTNHSSVLNKDGMTVRKINHAPVSQNIDRETTEKSRHDAALIASYSNADEIDIARDRNMKIDEFALANLSQKRTNLQENHQKNQQKIETLTKNKQPIPKMLAEEKLKNLAELNETDRQILAKKQEIESIRQRYDNDKQRYLELKAQGYTPSSIKHLNNRGID
jgi:vacuolar-type H+-ATPase subunit I/STV1